MKTQPLKLYGKIVKILPDSRFNVYCEKLDRDVLCYLSGKLKRGPKPAEGDEIKFEVDISNPNLGRISDIKR